MTIDRRTVVKGMGLFGLSVPFLGRSVTAPATPGEAAMAERGSTVLLVSAGAADSAFVHGARAGVGASGLTLLEASRELAFVLGFEQALRDGQPTRAMGMLDDALATLLIDLARSAGARVPWIGHHGCHASGSRHHRLSSTPTTERCAARLSAQLHLGVDGFMPVDEDRNRVPVVRGIATGARSADRADHWAAMLGYMLASPGTGDPGPAPTFRAGRTPLAGSFVSFLIES